MLRKIARTFAGENGSGRSGFRTAALVSLLVALPCYWQPRIQAGDLSSHIYNSWLAQLIESGAAEGLTIAGQTTNILFDLLLAGLFGLVGAEAAQRIAVTLAVLIFVWGAFVFITAVAGKRPWHLMPCLAMLAYGWVYHMGFFNFYMSLGLCFWGLAAAWTGGKRHLWAAAALFGLAYVAHALPLVWAGSLLGYLWTARRVAPRWRAALMTAALVLIGGANWLLTTRLVSRWSPSQFSVSTGADQTWVFGSKYYVVLVGLLMLWGFLFLDLLHLKGARRTVLGIPFQFCVLSAALVASLPSVILLPGYHHALVYIAERMSLGVGVCVCALLGAVRPKLWQQAGMAGVAAVFFTFLYVDERALNRFEDRMQGVLAGLPAGGRVVSGVIDPSSRVNALAHVIDRVCIRRCFSYANYEPSTAQFRIRALRPNPYVSSSYADSYAMQTGTYVPRDADLPLYQVAADAAGELTIKSLKAGISCGKTVVKVFATRGSS